MTDKNYGVYLEFVNPKTVFFEVKAASEKEAELIAGKVFADQHGLKIMHVFEITNVPTYKPKEPSKLITPQ